MYCLTSYCRYVVSFYKSIVDTKVLSFEVEFTVYVVRKNIKFNPEMHIVKHPDWHLAPAN